MLAGAAIAVGNVLMPALVRRSFPERAGAMTGAYTTALVGSAAVAAARERADRQRVRRLARRPGRVGAARRSSPSSRGRRSSGRDERDEGSPHQAHGARPLLRDPLAWQVTAYFGFQSCSFYIVLSWLPTIFQSHGYSRTTGGLLLALSLVAGLPGALLLPGVAARAREQGRFAFVYGIFVAAGLAGLLAAPRAAPVLWVVLLGIGQQASFPLALIMVVLRSRTLAETAGLSTLMQSVGYLVAAAGPLVAGALHDLTDSWTPAIGMLFGLTALQVIAGFGAGRDRKLSVPLTGE